MNRIQGAAPQIRFHPDEEFPVAARVEPPRPPPPPDPSRVTAFGDPRLATSSVERHAEHVEKPNQLDVVPQSQGDTNACGTTSLANVLSYWGQPTTHETIDASIRHFNLFTAPDAIVTFARDHGMRAELTAGASVEDLAKMVDQGVPPIVIIDPDGPQNLNLHYVTVCGYNRDPSGRIADLVIANSASGQTETVAADTFAKQWGHLQLGGVGTGLNNVMISIVPDDGRAVMGSDGVNRRAGDIQLPKSSASATAESLFARGVASATTGVTTAADAVWHGVQAAGKAVAGLWHSIFG